MLTKSERNPVDGPIINYVHAGNTNSPTCSLHVNNT